MNPYRVFIYAFAISATPYYITLISKFQTKELFFPCPNEDIGHKFIKNK